MDDLWKMISGRQARGFDVSRFFRLGALTAEQQRYLVNVYGVLALGAVCTVLGVRFPLLEGAAGLVGAVAVFALVQYIAATRETDFSALEDVRKPTHMRRAGAFFGVSYASGMMLAPAVAAVSFIDPAIVPTAVLATAVIFGGLSAAAIYCRDRRFLAMGGTLAAFLSYMAVASLANVFLRMPVINNVLVYAGLVVYSLLILHDTQAVLLEHERGSRDIVFHAVVFYGSLIALFVRLLHILVQKSEREERERRKR